MGESNYKKGKSFEKLACKVLTDHFNTELSDRFASIKIGTNEKKEHVFDFASSDKSIVVECKAYTWTEGDNTPSGKISTFNEAVYFLSFLPKDTIKILCIKKAYNSKKGKTLAEYYVNQYGHIIGDVIIFEISDEEGGRIENAWFDQNRVKNRDKLNLFFDTNSKKSDLSLFTVGEK